MKTPGEITNCDEMIDSRDIIARIEHLNGLLEALTDEASAQEGNSESDCIEQLAAWLGCDAAGNVDALSRFDATSNADLEQFAESDEARELLALRKLADEAEGYGDWHHGEALIRDSHFEDYARQLAEDIGAIPDDAQWPCTCIDWTEAADQLKADYTQVDFDGTTYFMRS